MAPVTRGSASRASGAAAQRSAGENGSKSARESDDGDEHFDAAEYAPDATQGDESNRSVDDDDDDDDSESEEESQPSHQAASPAPIQDPSLSAGEACPFAPEYRLPVNPFRDLTAPERQIVGQIRHVRHKAGQGRKKETRCNPPMASSKTLSWIFGFGEYERQEPKASREMIALKHGTTKNNMIQYFKKAFAAEYGSKELAERKYDEFRLNIGVKSTSYTPRYTKTPRPEPGQSVQPTPRKRLQTRSTAESSSRQTSSRGGYRVTKPATVRKTDASKKKKKQKKRASSSVEPIAEEATDDLSAPLDMAALGYVDRRRNQPRLTFEGTDLASQQFNNGPGTFYPAGNLLQLSRGMPIHTLAQQVGQGGTGAFQQGYMQQWVPSFNYANNGYNGPQQQQQQQQQQTFGPPPMVPYPSYQTPSFSQQQYPAPQQAWGPPAPYMQMAMPFQNQQPFQNRNQAFAGPPMQFGTTFTPNYNNQQQQQQSFAPPPMPYSSQPTPTFNQQYPGPQYSSQTGYTAGGPIDPALRNWPMQNQPSSEAVQQGGFSAGQMPRDAGMGPQSAEFEEDEFGAMENQQDWGYGPRF